MLYIMTNIVALVIKFCRKFVKVILYAVALVIKFCRKIVIAILYAMALRIIFVSHDMSEKF